MAKMVKAADLGKLSRDTSTLRGSLNTFLIPHVTFNSDILDTSLEAYESNPQLAILLSGTSDKKSKEYKSALRSVQYWKKGQSGPSKKYQPKLVRALSLKNKIPDESLVDAAGNMKNGVNIAITGYVQISNTPAEYRTLRTSMDSDTFSEFVDLALSGDNQQALELFADTGSYPSFDLYGSSTDPIVIQLS